MPEGIHVPALPQSEDPFQQTANNDIEIALQEISSRIQNITELNEDNLSELIDGTTEDSTPADDDKILLSRSGSLFHVEVSDLGGGGGGFPITPGGGSGRWFCPNALDGASRGNTLALTDDRCYFVPFQVSRAVSITQVALHRTAGNNFQSLAIGLYDTGTDGMPNNLLASVAKTTWPTGDEHTLAYDLDAGVTYWLALAYDGAGTSVAALAAAEASFNFGDATSGNAATDIQMYLALGGSWTALPDPFPGSPTYGTGNVPFFMLEFS